MKTTTNFKPTYLYIKRHSITGKLYFGKTVRKDIEKYNGSGSRWNNHIAHHGKEYVETLWYCLFYDEISIREFALICSKQWNIVKSENWLNLIEENGTTGAKPETRSGMTGKHHSEASNELNRIAHLGKTHTQSNPSKGHAQTEESKEKIRNTLTGVSHTSERVEKMRATKLGKPNPRKKTTCPHCSKYGDISLLKRWHFDNCKMKL